jgi:hypothetical protein
MGASKIGCSELQLGNDFWTRMGNGQWDGTNVDNTSAVSEEGDLPVGGKW